MPFFLYYSTKFVVYHPNFVSEECHLHTPAPHLLPSDPLTDLFIGLGRFRILGGGGGKGGVKFPAGT